MIDPVLLAEAIEKHLNYSRVPENLYHPFFGWVIRNGKPTKIYPEFQKWLEQMA